MTVADEDWPTADGDDLWPHYFSTYCIHDLHDQCRLTCKTCEAPCLCVCHAEAPESRPKPKMPDPVLREE